ncbi:MAG: hypothetical protein HY057_02530 [Rhodospirillales bacterium]|nr:hypothetical protein [Rhodospirillales bacterium]
MTDLQSRCIAIARIYVQDTLRVSPAMFRFWYGGLDGMTQRHRVYAAHLEDIESPPSTKLGKGSGKSMTLLVNEWAEQVEQVFQGQ